MPYYSVYGIRLKTNTEISCLSLSSLQTNPDISVFLDKSFPDDISTKIGDLGEIYFPGTESNGNSITRLQVNVTKDGSLFHFLYDTGVQFVCERSGAKAWGIWCKPYGPQDAVLYLLGPILGFMLRLRGITCLHASSIVVGNEALAILGPSGAGKSTLAAEFAASGYAILGDDLLPIREAENIFEAVSGYPRLKLWPGTLSNTAWDTLSLPQLTENWDKRYLDLEEHGLGFGQGSIPLGALYILDQGTACDRALKIDEVKPTAAVPVLATNTYRTELLDKRMRAEEFVFLGRLVNQVPVRRICGYRNVAALANIRERIIDDFQQIQCRRPR